MPTTARPEARRPRGYPRAVGGAVAELAIDLGTANTLVHADGRVVVDAPSVVAVGPRRRVVAAGHDAKAMLGRAPRGIRVVRPLAAGVVQDLDACGLLLGALLAPLRRSRRTRLVVSVPLDTTAVERHAVAAACERIGPAPQTVVDEPYAAAVGAGLPVDAPVASMLVDVGEGITEAVVLACGGVVAAASQRVGGADLDRALLSLLRLHHGLAVGDTAIERVKLGLALLEEDAPVAIGGLDLVSGRPRRLDCPRHELAAGLEEPLCRVVDTVRTALERTPPELSADLTTRGLTLSGGTALLPGLAERLRDAIGVPVHLAPDPLRSVIHGNAALL